MRHQLKTPYAVIAILVATVSLFGYSSRGASTLVSSDSEFFGSKQNILSRQDSLIQEMADILNPSSSFTKSEQKRIEMRIKSFPSKVVRRDTITYFLSTAYAIAYYEFYKKDFKKAIKYSKEFTQRGINPGYSHYFFDYQSVVSDAAMSLSKKGNFKQKKLKNAWNIYDINLDDYGYARNPENFINSFLSDVPMNLDIATYHKLLNLYKDLGGLVKWLNISMGKSFLNKCHKYRRQDIIELICNLWDIDSADFRYDTDKDLFQYIEPSKDTNTHDVGVKLIDTDIKYMFDPDYNLSVVDSLLSIGRIDSIGKPLSYAISLLYRRNEFHDIIDCGHRYEQYLKSNSIYPSLHNYWALAEYNLGNYDEAIRHYDIAAANAPSSKFLTTVRLNKGIALGVAGKTKEGVDIFISEFHNMQSYYERFIWHDNLGYIYSFSNPGLASIYYAKAEKYLDNGGGEDDIKARHFCRKARVLKSNKYLQRKALSKAMEYAIGYGCSNITKGLVYNEYADFLHSIYDYEGAAKYHDKAFQCYKSLSMEDSRLRHLYLSNAKNLFSLGQPLGALTILERLRQYQSSDMYLNESLEYAETLQSQISIRIVLNEPRDSIESLFAEYDSICDQNNTIAQSFDDIILRASYLNYIGDIQGAIDMLKTGLNETHLSQTNRIRLIAKLEEYSRENLNKQDYIATLHPLIESIPQSVIETLLVLSSHERKSIQNPLKQLLGVSIRGEDFHDALTMSLFRKGLLLSVRNSSEERLRKNRSTKKSYAKLLELRKAMTDAIMYDDVIHIPNISHEIERMESELYAGLRKSPEHYSLTSQKLNRIQTQLSPADIAIEFATYPDNGAELYGAFLIKNKGDVNFIYLGNYQELISDPHKIWHELQPYLSDSDNVYLSADGVLNSLPFEYLKDDDGIPAYHKYRLHRVFHLADIKPAEGIGDRVVAVGISDHNSPVGQGETIDRGVMTDLPNVAYEMQLIQNRIKPERLTLLFNDDATEERFKRLDNSDVTSLHISTHGIYRDNESLCRSGQNPEDEDYQMASRMLNAGKESLSGLILRQGNLAWKSEKIVEDNDDILTSEEIENMSFPNLRLTVLSACDSGLGDTDAEGVWGLQRAFRIAGSKSLICSLRKIDDYWAAQFMDAFYQYAASGETIYDSFRRAQKELYDAAPDNSEVWSSFILIE